MFSARPSACAKEQRKGPSSVIPLLIIPFIQIIVHMLSGAGLISTSYSIPFMTLPLSAPWTYNLGIAAHWSL